MCDFLLFGILIQNISKSVLEVEFLKWTCTNSVNGPIYLGHEKKKKNSAYIIGMKGVSFVCIFKSFLSNFVINFKYAIKLCLKMEGFGSGNVYALKKAWNVMLLSVKSIIVLIFM